MGVMHGAGGGGHQGSSIAMVKPKLLHSLAQTVVATAAEALGAAAPGVVQCHPDRSTSLLRIRPFSGRAARP